MRVDLIVIDGENDFLATGKEPFNTGNRRGALCVDGASAEAYLLADMIDRLRGKIHKIHATLDAHQRHDGSHNIAWKTRNGAVADPFTIVTHDMVKNQDFVPTLKFGVWEGQVVPSYKWALNYTGALDARGRNPLCLWPVHCEIGGWGSCVYQPLKDAYDRWCDEHNGWIDYVTKGVWPWTEHYSAIIADVPDPTRPETGMNTVLLDDAGKADIIVFAGWAGSHCTKWTGTDAVNYFGEDPPGSGSNEFVRKLVILEDCCAAVPDTPATGTLFADARKDWLDDMAKRGAKITTSKAFLS